MITEILIAFLIALILMLLVLLAGLAPGSRSEDHEGCLYTILVGFFIYLVYLGGKYLW